MSEQIQTINPQLKTLRTMLEGASAKLAEVAPKHLKANRLVRLLLSAASRNPKILECTPESVLNFAMQCSQTGLEPIGAGGMWPIPYRNNKNNTTELTALPDYRGLVNCAKHGGCIKDAYAEAVYEKDEFDYALGLEPRLTHKPARGDRGALDAAYCVIIFPDDTKRFVVMSRSEIDGIRKRSRASTSGPWVTDEAEMWKKTVVRRAMKPFAGASQELDKAIELDDKAGAVIDVTHKPAVPMPKAITENGSTGGGTATESRQDKPEPVAEGQDTQETGKSPHSDESRVTAEPKVLTWIGKTIGVNQGEDKKPTTIVLDDENDLRLKTWDKDLVKQAQAMVESKQDAEYSYRVETKGKFTNNIAVEIKGLA